MLPHFVHWPQCMPKLLFESTQVPKKYCEAIYLAESGTLSTAKGCVYVCIHRMAVRSVAAGTTLLYMVDLSVPHQS